MKELLLFGGMETSDVLTTLSEIIGGEKKSFEYNVGR